MRNASCSRDISMLNTADRTLVRDRGVLGDVSASVVLPIDGPARDDHQVAGLQPGGHACRGRCSRCCRPVSCALRSGAAGRAGRWSRRARRAAARNRTPLRCPALAISNTRRSASSTSSVAVRALVFVGAGGDLAADADQLPQQRALADDVGVGADVGGGRRVAREPARDTRARRVSSARPLRGQVLGQRDGIARLAALRELGDRLEDELVIAAVEILGAEPVRDRCPSARCRA